MRKIFGRLIEFLRRGGRPLASESVAAAGGEIQFLTDSPWPDGDPQICLRPKNPPSFPLGKNSHLGRLNQGGLGGSRSFFLLSLLLLAVSLSIHSCASLRIGSDGKIIRENFSRTYEVDFISIHPKINIALQDYAGKHQGNSFQVLRLGSDAVRIRGIYRGENDPDRFPVVITAKPVRPGKTRMEVEISSSKPGNSPEYLVKVANELFQIVEKATGIRPRK